MMTGVDGAWPGNAEDRGASESSMSNSSSMDGVAAAGATSESSPVSTITTFFESSSSNTGGRPGEKQTEKQLASYKLPQGYIVSASADGSTDQLVRLARLEQGLGRRLAQGDAPWSPFALMVSLAFLIFAILLRPWSLSGAFTVQPSIKQPARSNPRDICASWVPLACFRADQPDQYESAPTVSVAAARFTRPSEDAMRPPSLDQLLFTSPPDEIAGLFLSDLFFSVPEPPLMPVHAMPAPTVADVRGASKTWPPSVANEGVGLAAHRHRLLLAQHLKAPSQLLHAAGTAMSGLKRSLTQYAKAIWDLPHLHAEACLAQKTHEADLTLRPQFGLPRRCATSVSELGRVHAAMI